LRGQALRKTAVYFILIATYNFRKYLILGDETIANPHNAFTGIIPHI